MLTGASGAVAATYSFDAYGNPIGTTGSAFNPFLFAGEYTNAETGFEYLRARYYDPATGQFLSRDPIVWIIRETYRCDLLIPASLRKILLFGMFAGLRRA